MQHNGQRYIVILAGISLHAGVIALPSVLLNSGPWSIELITYLAVVTLGALMESVAVEVSRGLETRMRHQADPLALRVSAIVGWVILASFWLVQCEVAGKGETPLGPLVCGVVAAVFGIVLRCWSITTLKERFVSDITCDTPPVRTGPYQLLRHPGEAGMLFYVLGCLTITSSWIILTATAAILIPVSGWRIRRENAVLDRATNTSTSATKRHQRGEQLRTASAQP